MDFHAEHIPSAVDLFQHTVIRWDLFQHTVMQWASINL